LDLFAGYFVSCMSPNVHVATGVAQMAVMPFVLFGGFFVNLEYDMIIVGYGGTDSLGGGTKG
jgi:hypothetical protein